MTTKRKYKAVKENVDGDFYVADGCCALCGVPSAQAPDLFGGFDQHGIATHEQCFVRKQPTNEGELKKLIDVMAVQEQMCIRYGGQNDAIKDRIKSVGEQDQIDW